MKNKTKNTKTCPCCHGKGVILDKKFQEGDIVFAKYKGAGWRGGIDGRAIVIGYEECDEDSVKIRDRKGIDYIVPISCCELDEYNN